MALKFQNGITTEDTTGQIIGVGDKTQPVPKPAPAYDPSSLTPDQLTAQATGKSLSDVNSVKYPRSPSQKALDITANTPTPKNPDQIYIDKLNQSQGLISSISDKFGAMLTEQGKTNESNLQETNALNVARGLMGSPEAAAQSNKTTKANTQANDLILGQRAEAIAGVLKDIQTRSDAEYQREQDLYNQAQKDVLAGEASIAGTEATRAGTAATEAVTEAQKIANKQAQTENFNKLASTPGTVQWSDFEKTSPEQAKILLKATGYSESEAAFKWNAAKAGAEQIQWDKTPQKTATGYVFTGLDPKTGKMVSQEVNVPVSSDWTVSPGNMYQDTILYNKTTGEVKTLQSYLDSVPDNVSGVCADGITGGECGDFVHTIVDNVPQMGDTLASKQTMINKQGTLAVNWKPKIGDVVIQNYGATGHAAVVVGVNGDQLQLKQSNLGMDGKVSTTTISAKDPSIYGAYTKGNIKTNIADGTMSPRELALQQKLATLKRTEALTDSSKAILVSRRNTIVSSVIKNLFGSTAKNPASIYYNSAQSINRINPALKEALDKGTIAKNVPDLDLIDAYVQVARQGGQVTEAQVDTLMSGLGIKAKFDVATQKITGSATLDDDTRKQLGTLTKEIYDQQGNSAKQAVDMVNKQLTKEGVSSEYLLESPQDLTVSANTPSLTPQQITDFQGQLSAGEVLATDSEGNVVAATQDDINSGDYTPINP